MDKNLVDALSITVRLINDHVISFYDGRDLSGEPDFLTQENSWIYYGAMSLGLATYAIHKGNKAVVFDSMSHPLQGEWVKNYLRSIGIKHFTLVNSHWHLDHVAGNASYKDDDIIATYLTRKALETNKQAIEEGTTDLGPPGISVVLPNIAYYDNLTLYLDDLRIELLDFNIHSQDGTSLYIPEDKILFAGDMLEDTVTFILNPEDMPTHIAELNRMKELDIKAIYPNHGDPEVIASGGYDTTFIDATIDYDTKMLTRAHDANFHESTIEDLAGDSIGKGWVHYFEPYEEVHKLNLKTVSDYYRDKDIPSLK